MSTPAPPRSLEEFAQLVRDAFATAAAAGKSPNMMTTAVLKNRLLLATKRQFSEHDYGERSLVRLLEKLPDLIELDHSRRPSVAHLKTALSTTDLPSEPDADLRRLRVRSDLWDAVLDISGTRYVWDATAQRIRPASDDDSAPYLPSLSRDDLDEERVTFARQHWTVEEGSVWISHGGSVKALPAHVRGQWAERLKRLVVGVLDKWFDDAGVAKPVNFYVAAGVRPSRPSAPIALTDSEGVRRYVLAVVTAMTEAELGMLQLPASAVARISAP